MRCWGGKPANTPTWMWLVALADVEAIKRTLSSSGFVVAEDELPTRLVLQDRRGRQIDFHTATFDPEGGGRKPLQDGRSYRYPPEHRVPMIPPMRVW